MKLASETERNIQVEVTINELVEMIKGSVKNGSCLKCSYIKILTPPGEKRLPGEERLPGGGFSETTFSNTSKIVLLLSEVVEKCDTELSVKFATVFSGLVKSDPPQELP